jgi:hypothetical protein
MVSNSKDWKEQLGVAELAYNNSWYASLNSTPYRFTYGEDPNIPFAMELTKRGVSQGGNLYALLPKRA